MGFWHTGYIEFHEPAGLPENEIDVAPEFSCPTCGAKFASPEGMARHRLEAHPFHQPTIFVRDIQLGATPLLVSRRIEESDCIVAHARSAYFNGKRCDPSVVPQRLCDITNDVVKIVLEGDGGPAAFELQIRVAAEADLLGVEREFFRLAEHRDLSIGAVERFIASSRQFPTAVTYLDGICHYFYGVLAKERSPDSALPYDAYQDRLTHAVHCLQDTNRPLANKIRGLVAFHFNHFADVIPRSSPGVLSEVARRYLDVLDGTSWRHFGVVPLDASWLESALVDNDTLKILRWASMDEIGLAGAVHDLESAMSRCPSGYDRLKLQILLASSANSSGNVELARRVARGLVAVPMTVKLAERLLAAIEDLVGYRER